MTNGTCNTCRFAAVGEPSPQTLRRQMLCHRHPPVPMLTPMPGGVGMVAHWTPITPESWCGEHEPKMESFLAGRS